MTTSTPSTQTDLGMTEGQIGKLNELLAAGLRKARGNFRATDVQLTLERCGPTIVEQFIKSLEELVATTANTIVRTVKVNRHRSPKEMIAALNRAEYTYSPVVKTIPKGEGEKVTVEFFKLGKCVSDNNLAREYEKRGLTPDPYAQAAVNDADPTFVDEYPNGTHWKDEDGNWCLVAFRRLGGKLHVSVHCDDGDWEDGWWFGGVRKSRPLEN